MVVAAALPTSAANTPGRRTRPLSCPPTMPVMVTSTVSQAASNALPDGTDTVRAGGTVTVRVRWDSPSGASTSTLT